MKSQFLFAVLFAITIFGNPQEMCAGDDQPVLNLPMADRPEDVGLSSVKLLKVDEVMNRRIAENRLAGGTVAIARDGKVVFIKAYGDQKKAIHNDQENIDSIPMKVDTIFRLYSMSKAITSSAIMMLRDQGKLSVDDPASKYVPVLADVTVQTDDGVVKPTRPITIADLLRHSSGLHFIGDPVLKEKAKIGEAEDLEDFVKRLVSVPLAAQPGTQWIYGHSIDVLGLIVQKVSGQPLHEFLEENLLKPLEMVDTGFFVPKEKLHRFADVYHRKTDPENSKSFQIELVKQNAFNRHFHQLPKIAKGGTGMVGTTADYMRFMLMIANGGEWEGRRYLSKESVELMTTNKHNMAIPVNGENAREGIQFGLGFCIVTKEPSYERGAHIGEYSWGGAANTNAWASPHDKGLIVVYMEQVFFANYIRTRSLLRSAINDAIMEEE